MFEFLKFESLCILRSHRAEVPDTSLFPIDQVRYTDSLDVLPKEYMQFLDMKHPACFEQCIIIVESHNLLHLARIFLFGKMESYIYAFRHLVFVVETNLR